MPSLAFFDETANRYQVDDGLYGLQLGSSSADIAQQAFVTVSGALRPVPSVVTVQPVLPGDAASGVAQRVFFPVGATNSRSSPAASASGLSRCTAVSVSSFSSRLMMLAPA